MYTEQNTTQQMKQSVKQTPKVKHKQASNAYYIHYQSVKLLCRYEIM